MTLVRFSAAVLFALILTGCSDHTPSTLAPTPLSVDGPLPDSRPGPIIEDPANPALNSTTCFWRNQQVKDWFIAGHTVTDAIIIDLDNRADRSVYIMFAPWKPTGYAIYDKNWWCQGDGRYEEWRVQ